MSFSRRVAICGAFAVAGTVLLVLRVTPSGASEPRAQVETADASSAQRIEDLTFITADIALAHVRSELSGDERAPGQAFPYRKTILFTKQRGVWRIRALRNTRLLDPEPPIR